MSTPRLTAAQRRERDSLAMLGAIVLACENAGLVRLAVERIASLQVKQLRILAGLDEPPGAGEAKGAGGGMSEPCKHTDLRIAVTPADAEYSEAIYSIRCQKCGAFAKLSEPADLPLVTIYRCRYALTRWPEDEAKGAGGG